MIEFKAECGHIVRVKDDSRGDVVRCSYCGQEARVPIAESSGLDYLYNDVEQSKEEPKRRRRRRKKPGRKSVSAGGRSGGIDLVSVILRMCYAAFLLIVVIYVGKLYVLPHIGEKGADPVPVEVVAPDESETTAPEEVRRAPRVPRKGLFAHQNAVGLYVNCIPPGAVAYYLEESRAPEEGRIYDVRGVVEVLASDTWARVPDGTYVVEVALPWNDPHLSDPKRPYYEHYRAFRRAIEHASDEKRRELLEEYFVPDGAVDVFVDQGDGQIYLVRQYDGIHVRNGRSRGVRALFLPKIASETGTTGLPGGGGFSLQALVDYYLPKEKVYAFNETHVRNELEFYEVPVSDRRAILQALTSVGIAPYVTPDGRTRLFGIGVTDGAFSARIIRDETE